MGGLRGLPLFYCLPGPETVEAWIWLSPALHQAVAMSLEAQDATLRTMTRKLRFRRKDKTKALDQPAKVGSDFFRTTLPSCKQHLPQQRVKTVKQH